MFDTEVENTDKGGYWKYSVTVRDVENSKILDMRDPGVVIKRRK